MAEKIDARTPTDFAALIMEEVEAETSARGNEIDNYPNILTMVQTAKANGRAAIVPPRKVKGEPNPALPTAEARKLALLFRQAAKKLNLGISVYLIKDEKDDKWSRIRETQENPYTGTRARVRFQPGEPRFFDPDKPRRPTWQKDMLKSRYDELWKVYEQDVKAWNDTHEKKIVLGKPADAPSRAGRPKSS